MQGPWGVIPGGFAPYIQMEAELRIKLKRVEETVEKELNRSLSSRQTKKQKILLKMVSVICRGHLFMQHPASYGNSLVRGNLDDADAVGSCSNE